MQKKINEQCLQMEPAVRPPLTVVEKDGKNFVATEIPGMDISERPCYYKGQGRVRGSYVRVGDSNEPMTEYEVYSYEAFRKNIRMTSGRYSALRLPCWILKRWILISDY